MPKRLSPIEKEKFLNKILIEKIGSKKIKLLSEKENILKKGIIDSMDFADIFSQLKKNLILRYLFKNLWKKQQCHNYKFKEVFKIKELVLYGFFKIKR